MFVVYRLAKTTNDSGLQGSIHYDLIGVCGHEDGGNRVPQIDETLVQLNAGHSRHLDVSDETAGFRRCTGCQEISG